LARTSLTLIRIGVLEEHVDNVIRALGRKGLVQFTDFTLSGLGPLVEPAKPSEELFTYSNLVSRIDTLTSSLRIPTPSTRKSSPPEGKLSKEMVKEVEDACVQLENARALVIANEEEVKKVKAEVKELEELLEELERLRKLRRVGVRRRIMEIRARLGPDPEGRLKELEAKLKELEAKGKELKANLERLVKEQGPNLYAYKEILVNEIKFEEVKGISGRAGRLYLFEAWTPKENVARVKQILDEQTEGYYLFEEAKLKVYEEAEAPTRIEAPPALRSYQSLVNGFGVPTSYELNPAFLMFITFPIIFGFMFGDVGHGLLLLIGGLYFYYLRRKGVKVFELFEPIVRGADVLILCAVTSIIIGGLFYGVFFGSNVWYNALFNLKGPPIPLASLHQPIPLLKLSLYIGIFHITLGLLLDIVNRVRNGELRQAVSGPLMWLIFYVTVGGLFMYYSLVVRRASRFISDMFVFDLSKLPIPVPPLIIILGLFIVMLIVRVKLEEPVEGFGSALESFVASMSNTISYARIFAFFLVHHAISEIGLMGGIEHAITPIGLFAFVLATFLIISIELLATFMQTLRLHWVEWFLKFYEGSGKPFTPLLFVRQYTVAP